MASAVVINLDIRTNSGQTLGQLNTDLKATLSTIEELTTAQDFLNESLAKAAIGSEEYKQLQQQLQVVNNSLAQIDLENEAMDAEKFGSSVKGLAGGLTDVAGGLALIGVSGEGVEKIAQTFAQVEGLSKIVGGALDVYNEGLKVTNVLIVKATAAHTAMAAAQTAQGNATGLASIKMRALNLIMSANPVLLLVTGVTLLVGAFAALSSGGETTEEQLAKLETKMTDLNKTTEDAIKWAGKFRAEYTKQMIESNNSEIISLDQKIKKLEEVKDRTSAQDGALKSLYAQRAVAERETVDRLNAQRIQDIEDEKKFLAQKEKNNVDYEQRLQYIKSQQSASDKAETQKKINDLFQERKDAEVQIKLLNQQLKTNQIEYSNAILKIDFDRENALDKLREEALRREEERINKYKSLYGNLTARVLDLKRQEEDAYATTEEAKIALEEKRATAELNSLREQALAVSKTAEEKTKIETKYAEGIEQLQKNQSKKLLDIQQGYVNESKKITQQRLVDEMTFVQEGVDEALQIQKSAQQQELDAVRDKWFARIELAKQLYGVESEEVIAMTQALNIEIDNINKEYNQKDIDADKERRERLEAFYELIKETFSGVSNIISAAFSGGDFEAINESFSTFSDSVSKFTSEVLQKAIADWDKLTDPEKLKAVGDFATELTQTVTEAIGAILDARAEKQKSAFEEQEAAESEFLANALANRQISQAEYDAANERLQEKKREREKKADMDAFARAKKLALINAIIGTAQAVISAFASGAAVPIIGAATGAVYAAIAGALGAAQIGIIASQQYKAARGGIVPGNGPGAIDSVPALLAPGEAVINANSTKMFAPVLSEINRLGGGTSLVPEGPSMNGMGSSGSSGGGNSDPVRAYVLEGDITDKQARMNRLKRSKEFFV